MVFQSQRQLLFVALLTCLACRAAAQPYLTARIGDVAKATTDFDLTVTGDTTGLVESILGTDEKPILKSGVTGNTVSSAASFDEWFADPLDIIDGTSGRSTMISRTWELADESGGIYSYNGNADETYPIDGDGVGDEGDAHNFFYTVRIKTFITRTAGHVFTLSSAGGDAWMFINNRLALDSSGITTLRTRLLDFDDFASANGIGEGARVPVHIFYAHRSRNIAPVLGVEISAPVTCNAATAGQQRPVFPFATGTGGNTLLDGAVSIGTPNRLDLIRSGEPQVSSAAWHANRLHMRSGFVHDFRFRITPDSGTAEGFAWVMNADSNTARGLETFNLAYNDIPNSLAVEFDTNQNSLASDPNSNHISVHTEYDDPNSAVESSSIGRTASLLVDLADGADHTARIEYTAPDGATSGSIAVSVDGFVRVNAIIDTAGMKRAFPNGYAYFGFTGSSSSSTGSVRIDNWQAWHVPAAAVRTTTSPAIPASVMANDAFSAASSVLLLATDACGARIEDSLDTSVVASFSGTERVTDMGDGSYNIEFYDTVAEAHTLALSVNNEALSDSPFDIEVTAAATSAAHSIYSSASSLSEIVVGNSQLLTVVARDRFSNNRTVFGEQFTVQFSNTAPFALLASGTYDFIVRTFVAGDVQLYVRFKGVDIAGSPLPGGVSVSPGAPSPSTSTASGSGLQSAVAGQPATFYVTPYDAYSNRVVEDSSPTISARMTHADSGVSTVSEDSVTWDDGLKQYAVTYTPTVSGLYTYVVRLDFIVVVENAPSQRLNVVPGAFNATESELSLDFTGTVGLLQEVNIETKDAQGNSRTSALATKGRLQARVVFSSTTINVLCDPASAEPANALSAQCVYSAAGVYRLTFDPIESVSHTISVRDTAESNELVGASSEFVSVAAGAVSISDSFITIVDLEAVAGVGQTFRITAQDEHLNVRVSNDDSSIFQVTARLSTDSTVVAATSTADNNGSGEYVVTWTPTVAGDYDISVTVAGQHVNGSPEDGASCVPASTSATGTLVFGQGLSGGVTGETATFTIEARDEFSNPQPTSPVDQFVVTFAATPAFTFNEVVTPLTNGQYSVTYDVPTLTSERTSFTITIDINGGAQVLSKTAQIADSGDSSAAVASGAGLTASVAGQQASFTITDPVPSATTTFSVTIEGNGGEAVPNDRIAVTPEGSGVYTVQYQPRLSGNYTIRIFKDGAVETAESIAGLPTMVCSPGPINHLKSIVSGLPAVIEAGTTYTYTVRARDSEGNNLEEGGLTINTTWTPSGDRPTTVNVIDNNDGTYSVELTPEKAAEFLSVQNNEGGTPIGPQYKVVLTPTSASADNSDYDQTFEVVAGETARIVRLSIKDRFGNAVDSGGSGTFAIDLEENDGLVPTFEYVGEGLFDVVVTPQASSGQQLNLTVTVGGDPISNSPAQVTVRPSDPDSTQSFVTGMDDATVGDPMAIELNVRDAFNNSWLDNRFLVRVIITDVDLGEESDLLFETGELFDGRYSITSPEYVKATSYSFEFIVNGLALTPTGLRNITVAPAPADASKTTFEPLATTELPVGGTFSLTIEARDLYSNLRGTGGDAITFAFYTNDDDVCTESASEAQSGTFTTDVTDHGNGTYLLEWSTEQAGAWRTVVSLNGAPIRVCSSSLEFNVAPGAASGAHSTLTAQAAVAVGTVQTVSLIMRDRFCNEVGSGGQTVLVGTAPVSATAGSQCAEDTDWLTLANGANVTSTTDHEDGTFTILYTATKAGEFDLVVTVNGELVRDSVLEPVCPDSTAEIDVCRTVTITPGYVYTFTTPDASHETTRAALERSYEIESLDIYDNTATNTEHSYKVSFTRNTTRSTTYAESEGVEYSFDIATQSVAGFHAVPYVSSWSGSFDVEITLDDPANQNRDRARTQYSYTLDVAPATCRAADASTTYRCPNGTCVASYDDCVEASVVSCNVSIGQVSCPEGCAAGCACPDGSVACEANGGYCVEDASECPRSAWDVCPASMPHRCTDSEAQECRASAPDCPSRPVCPPGTTLCPDAKSCAYDSERCFSPIHDNADACGGLAPVRCASGACVASSADCPTPITCRNAAHVVCPDGSCRATPDECPSIAPCTGAAAVRCPDGSCRASEDLCPSDVVCPLGWLRCGGRGTECARSVSECSGVEAECGADTVRCSDGTCRPNVLLCPSRVSCSADTPVQCADGTCVASAAFCSSPVACPAARPLRCPSGACGIDADDCATLPSCPSDRPTLCPDLSCAETPGDCDPSRVCPAARPYRCADGTCVADSSWCPTYAPCPPLMPVRCASSECAVSIQDCPSESLIACEATQVRCPDGSCALHASLCPSQIACQGSTRRCRDGTCRTSCDGIDESDSKRLVECLPGQIKCPLVHTGVSCASSLADCPSSTVCPTSLPFKCADASCAASPAECPPSQTSLDGAGACPGGTFEGSAANCGTRVTCPADYPVKCYDESCRKVPEDCPTMPACPASIPFLCQDGSCVGSLLSCRSSRSCNADRPVKCPWYNSARGCVANVDECLDIAEEVEGVNGECPDGATRCRSGECRALRSECAELECPHHLPFRCSGGACARSEAECPLENGCPYHSPNKCYDGSCSTECATPVNCSLSDAGEFRYRCPDGACASALSNCRAASGCTEEIRGFPSVRCHDKQCGTGDDCVSGSSTFNKCPVHTPIRCSDGRCAASSRDCPRIPVRGSCNGNTDALQVRCADGTCVESAGQCPVLQPCDEFRCSDGTCRLSEDECPEAGGCPSWARVRCCDGSCAVSPTACLATEDSSGECRIGSGCPDGQSRCPINGQCVTKVSSCPDVAEPSNGCAPELPVKCPNSGECVTSADVCPLANGCSSATPKLCSNGQCVTLDATCASDGACPAGQQCEISGRCGVDCRTTRHCPYDAPLRCANGECAAACNATIVCTAAAPVLCADGECVPHQRLCRPMHNCPVSAPILCADKRSCQVTAEACDAVEVECPASRPLLCKSGACVSSAVECPERELPCEVAGEVRCFDGLCRASYHLCQLAQDLGGKTSAVATPVARDMSAVCEAGEFLCPAGECVADRRECSLVEACPWSLPYSCADGTCRESADTCPEVVECADVGATRCDDGSCRTGECPLSNRCGAGTTRCGADGTCRTSCVGATGEGGEWFREVNVLAQTFAVDRNEDTELPVAFDSRGVVRARLMVPSGAVKGAGGTAQVATFPVKVWPVSVSELRATTTTVHSTRRADYGGRSSLPFDEGVLSPAFRCEIGGELSFALTYSAFADKINNEVEPVKYADVCLAQLDAASTRWSCVRSAYEDRVSETVYSVDPEDEEVRSGALARHYLSSFLGSCDGTTAYAFVQEPLRTPPVPEAAAAASYFERHKTAIIAGVTSAAVISLVMMYVFWRLYRYRIKYKQKQKEEVELQSRKDFIEENAGGLGVAGDGIDMMVNPMVVQMQDLSEQLERVQQELGIQEANDTGKLDTLEHERNNIKAEMAEVQRQLDLENMRHEQSGTRPLRQGSGRSALTSSRSGNVPTSSSVDEFANTPVPRTQSSGRRSRGFGPAKAKKKTFS